MVNPPPPDPSPAETARRKAWLKTYGARLHAQPDDLPLRCPCCGCRTTSRRGDSSICPVCFWEDDGQDDYDADVVRGGPNGRFSLSKARENFALLGACDGESVGDVRKPRPEELPE